MVTLEPASEPAYLQALMPTPEDQADAVATDKLTNQDNPSPEASQSDGSTSQPGGGDQASVGVSVDTFVNPFLKPPKRIKLRSV